MHNKFLVPLVINTGKRRKALLSHMGHKDTHISGVHARVCACRAESSGMIPLVKFTRISRLQLWLHILGTRHWVLLPQTVYEAQESLSHYSVFTLGWGSAWRQTQFTNLGSEWVILNVHKSKWCCAWTIAVYIIVQAPLCVRGRSMLSPLQVPRECF